MADNTTINSGSGGDTIATDDIGGIKYQRVKITLGADGVTDGDVSSSNALPISDNGGSLTVDGTVAATQSGTWNVTNVSGTVSLPTGAATLAEQQTQTASLSVLDDWDESDRAKVNPIVGQAGIAAGAGAVGVTVPRVTLASDDPAVVALQIIDNAISGNEMQVDIVTMPTVTVNSHAVTNVGTFAVQVDGSALTALQLIDDTVFSDDSAFTPATSKVNAVGFLADETATDSVDEGNVGAARMTLDRKVHVATELETSSMRASGTARVPKFAVISGSTSGNNTLVAAAGASLKIRVLSLYLVAAGTVGVKFQSGAGGTDLSGLMSFIANTGIALPFNPLGHFETAANTLLNMNLNAAIQVSGGLTYVEAT